MAMISNQLTGVDIDTDNINTLVSNILTYHSHRNIETSLITS